MPSDLRSPKTLANWIELDYPNRRRLFGRGWKLLLLGTLLASGLALSALALGWGHRAFQAGPVSMPHAMFNGDCQKCHDGDFSTLARLWGGTGISVPDHKCLACHAGSHHNPPHAAMGRCVDCHKEHRGHAALVRVDDTHCVRCHQDLRREDGSEPRFERHVTAFTTNGHPPVRTATDPGTVRFNHAVHLATAGVMDLASRRLVRLHCDDCHQPEADGKTLKPIAYDLHCSRCHPLGAPIVGSFADAERKKLARDFAALRLPHPRPGQSAAVVRAALRDQLTRFITGPKGPLFLGAPVEGPRRPLPGQPTWEKLTTPEKEFLWVRAALEKSEDALFTAAGGCAYCHATPEAPLRLGGDGLPLVPPAAIPSRWWKHATFDHQAHRFLDCAQCHKARDSGRTEDVLLPSLDTCLTCHTRGARSSARGDCVECHVFHDPAAQRAARARGGALTLEPFHR